MESTDRKADYALERWIIFFLTLLFFVPFIARGQESPGIEVLPVATLGEVEDSALLFKTAAPGVYAIAPRVSSEVEISVVGPIVRTRVRQTFMNTTKETVEGVYVFPLPELSAVDTLKMTIGSRIIEGVIREREDAARQYQKARTEGRKAALVEQHRPNVFTTSVASIGAGEDAIIEIEYQEVARFESGEYRLRFPMVVAERYTPAGSDSPPSSLGAATVRLSVDLKPGHGVREIRSPNHRISTKVLGHNHHQVVLDESNAHRPNSSLALGMTSDFELIWRPDLGSKPEATILTETVGEETYALVMLTPPPTSPIHVVRETVFIIDSSGSMEGASMQQAKQALLLALGDLRPGDTFNVIDFDSDAHALFTESQPVGQDTVAVAQKFVESLTADGGTEMLKAIQLALPAAPRSGTLRQVIFMTDGQVGNEQQLFSYIHENLGESRLFTVGIGSAPNSYFMRNAARFGRGTFTYIGDVAQVKERMGELFEKLSSPVMTSIEIDTGDPTAEVWPSRIPDLYRSEPLAVTIRLSDLSAPIVVRGSIGGEKWTRQLAIPPSGDGNAIGKLWARQKIEAAMDRLSEGASPAGVRTEVVAVALRHHLVSQFTSLVAIDHTPTVPGTLPQTATPSLLLIICGLALASLSAATWRLS
ncbi:MAG: VWA domain-containing protein [Thermoanaerobaculia bacterium]|nr:VWA domain-containing protein [Thermoanaerobaculia bacterium]